MYKNKDTSIWNVLLNSGLLENFATAYRSSNVLSWRKVDAQSVIIWTVVGQPSWQYLRAPTLDHCSSSQRSWSTILSRGSISDSWYLFFSCFHYLFCFWLHAAKLIKAHVQNIEYLIVSLLLLLILCKNGNLSADAAFSTTSTDAESSSRLGRRTMPSSSPSLFIIITAII